MIHDEYRYAQRYGLMQDTSKETVTFRNNRDEKALPMRELGSFLLGSNVGGSGVHWNGQTWRFLPYDFEIKSMTEEKDRKSTRLNSSHVAISYAVICLKKKKKTSRT